MPFIKTAVLGSPGAPVIPKGDYINHFNIVRIRATGDGILRPTMYSQDDIKSSILPIMELSSLEEYPLQSLSNFMSPRCSLRVETTAIDEVFRINRIVIYSRPVFADIPR